MIKTEINLGRPQPKQDEFLTANERFVAYGGSRGGGKSWALRFKLKALCLLNPGIKCLIIRRTYAELYRNHIEILVKELSGGAAVYREKSKSFTFYNGSILQLGYCDSERDVLQYQGQEYDIIAIDEATQLTEYQFQCFKACLRGANAFPKRMYLTCNPGGVGHAWVKRLFIDREYRRGENGADYRFIGAKVYDNFALIKSDPEYVSGLESLPDDMRRAWLEGEWDVFDGQFFREFDTSVHVCEPFEIPDGWYRYRAIDYGLDMLACIWAAAAPDGRFYIYREYNCPGLIVSEAAEKILSLTPPGEVIRATFAPPDLWARQKDSGKTMFEIFCESGLDVIKASSDRVQGWAQVRELLRCRRSADGSADIAVSGGGAVSCNGVSDDGTVLCGGVSGGAKALANGEFLSVGEKRSIGENLSTGKSFSAGESFGIGESLNIGENVIDGEELSFGGNASVGEKLNFGGNESVGKKLSIGVNESVGENTSDVRALSGNSGTANGTENADIGICDGANSDSAVGGEPRLRIFSVCRELIRNIPLLQYSAHNPNDAATEPHGITHNTDALRYFCVSRSECGSGPKPEEARGAKLKRRVFEKKRRRRRW